LNNLEVLRKRNILMMEIMWIMSIIYIGFSTLSGVDKKSLIIIAPILVGISTLLSFFVWKKTIENKLKYIAAVGLGITHFLFVLMFHDLNNSFCSNGSNIIISML